MNGTVKTHLPVGIDESGSGSSITYTPASVTVVLRDGSTDTIPVAGTDGNLKTVLDFTGKDYRPEDILEISEREACEADSGSLPSP